MITTTNHTKVRLFVREVNENTLSVKWEAPDQSVFNTRVDRKIILAESEKAREALRRFVDTWCERKPPNELIAKFITLCQGGYKLYKALFITVHSSESSGVDVRRWLESFSTPLRIVIKVDSNISVPWNILRTDENFTENGIRANDWSNVCESFWGLRFAVSASTYGVQPQSARVGPVDTYDVVTVAHEQIHNAACVNLQDVNKLDLESDRQAEKWVRDVWGKSVYSFAEFFDRWQRNSELAFRLAYFLGHADESRFELASDGIDSDDFALKITPQDNDAARRRILLFLNGCSTAGQPKLFGWMRLLRFPGLNGMIGTEVPIPDLFGFRFANAFLYFFLGKGMTVHDALWTLRVAHLPLSLVYSAYATDTLAVVPKAGTTPLPKFENFSLNPNLT